MTPFANTYFRARYGAVWITARHTNGAWFDRNQQPLRAPDEWMPLGGSAQAEEKANG